MSEAAEEKNTADTNANAIINNNNDDNINSSGSPAICI